MNGHKYGCPWGLASIYTPPGKPFIDNPETCPCHIEVTIDLPKPEDLPPHPLWRMKLPPEYAKRRLVVPDRLVDAFRDSYGDAVEIISVSETMLPNSASE